LIVEITPVFPAFAGTAFKDFEEILRNLGFAVLNDDLISAALGE